MFLGDACTNLRAVRRSEKNYLISLFSVHGSRTLNTEHIFNFKNKFAIPVLKLRNKNLILLKCVIN